MSHPTPGLLSKYNSLTDKHLAGYFSNTRIRRHLQRAGLITRSGRIVPDKEYRHKLIQRAHQRHVQECLAQAIFHKVLEMERLHQIEIRRKLEEFARKERVRRMKVERSKRYEKDVVRIISPHPPPRAGPSWKQHSGLEHSEFSESASSSRPNTAPGKMQRPVRLKPIHSNSTTASLQRSSPYRLGESAHPQPVSSTMVRNSRRRVTTKEPPNGFSPYCLPVINNFVTPIPPAGRREERGSNVTASITIRGRRLRPTTTSSGPDDPPWLRSSISQSHVRVRMLYYGKTVRLASDLMDTRDEVKVFQQHCGGENLCVYKGRLSEGEAFEFISRRHRGFPFSLTFYLNGLQVERLSSCCEFKHRKGYRLGGRHGNFGFFSVEGASPCYKCIIAIGLDKKPTPPPKRLREDKTREEPELGPKREADLEPVMTGEGSVSPLEGVGGQAYETEREQQKEQEQDKVRDDYEEDFEADDEGPVEEELVREKKSPLSDVEEPIEEKEASETEEEDKDDFESRSGSSITNDESEAEAINDEKANKTAGGAEEAKPEEAPSRAEATPVEGVELQDPAEGSRETSVSAEPDLKLKDEPSEQTRNDLKLEVEPERAKSVQEKLAEAILKESQCSTEPEPSDTSTDEEEGQSDKAAQEDNKDEAQEKHFKTSEAEFASDEEDEKEGLTEETAETKEGKEEEKRDDDEVMDEDEKAPNDEATEEGARLEEPGDIEQLVEEDLMSQNDKTEDFKCAEADTSDNQQATEDVDTQPAEAGESAKSVEEDESSGLEQSKDAHVEAEADEAEEAAAAASETIEIKAPSSAEREALSGEEARDAAAEARRQTDGEGRAHDSSLEETHEDALKDESSTQEQTLQAEKRREQSLQEEKEETSAEVDETDEGTEKKADAITEGTGKSEEGKTDEIIEEIKTNESTEENIKNEEETERLPDEEGKDTTEEIEEGSRETPEEKDEETAEESEEVKKSEPAEATSDQGQTHAALEEIQDEEEQSETSEDKNEKEINENPEKVPEPQKEEREEKHGERKEMTEDNLEQREETHDITEVPEKVEDANVEDDIGERKEEKTSEEMAEEVAESGGEQEETETEEGREEAPKEGNEEAPAEEEEKHHSTEDESAGVKELVGFGDVRGTLEGRAEDQAEAEAGTETEEARKDDIMEEGDNENKSDINHEDKEFDLTESKAEDITDVEPLRGDDANKDEESLESTPPHSVEQIQAETTNRHEEGEEGSGGGEDAEEVSKASEEGASVLLKPRAESSEAEQTASERKASPEASSREDNMDLVTNWIAVHQTSKFFETFVEPLENLMENGPDPQEPKADTETKSEVGERVSEPDEEENSVEETQAEAETDLKNLEADQSMEELNKAGSADGDKAEVESVKENPADPEPNMKQASSEPLSKPGETEESESPNEPKDADETGDAPERPSDFMNSADRGLEEPHHGFLSKEPDGRDLRLIEDIKDTFSKDRPSAFSLFAPTLLTASGAESGQ